MLSPQTERGLVVEGWGVTERDREPRKSLRV